MGKKDSLARQPDSRTRGRGNLAVLVFEDMMLVFEGMMTTGMFVVADNRDLTKPKPVV
jgi:hypothetical protein